MDIKGTVKYFKSLKDVSALYVFGSDSWVPDDSTMGLGVLADDAGLEMDVMDMLEHECILRSDGPLSVVMLNSAPLYLKHYVASKGRVVYERQKGSHLRFTRRALDEYSSVAFFENAFELHLTGQDDEFFGSDEQYLS